MAHAESMTGEAEAPDPGAAAAALSSSPSSPPLSSPPESTDEMDGAWSEAPPSTATTPSEPAAPAVAEAAPPVAEVALPVAEPAPLVAEPAPPVAEPAPSVLAESTALPPPPPLPKRESVPAPTLPSAASAPLTPSAPPFSAPVVVVSAPSAPPPARYSSAPPVVATRSTSSRFPDPITEDDLADELRPPGFFETLRRTKPGGAWLALGVISVIAAFVGGTAIGRGTAPVPLPPVPVPALPAPPAEIAPALRAAEAAPGVAATPSSSSATVTATAPSASAAPSPATPAVDAKPAADAKSTLPPFNAKAAKTNLGNAATRAGKCHVNGDPTGNVSVVVSFGTSGHVTDVSFTTPSFAGTKTGRCIVSKLSATLVPPFSGSPEALKKVVALK